LPVVLGWAEQLRPGLIPHLGLENAVGADHGVRNIVPIDPRDRGPNRNGDTCGPKLKVSIFTSAEELACSFVLTLSDSTNSGRAIIKDIARHVVRVWPGLLSSNRKGLPLRLAGKELHR